MVDSGATVRTTNGRAVAYAETGQPDGAPLFYLHGLPGSRWDFHYTYNAEALIGTGVRMIGIDRPGFGESDYQPRRRYSDWPLDLVAVADHLGLDRFGLLAYSAGGPYAIACALAFPDRLSSVAIVSGVGPAEMPAFHKGMGTWDTIMSRLSRWAPPLARRAIALSSKLARERPEKFSSSFDKELSQEDRAVHAIAELRQTIRDLVAESTRDGPRAVVEDYRVWSSPSGLDFGKVQIPVRLWHGDSDEVVPLHQARYVADTVPGAELVVLPGVGHLHTAARWREIITAAVEQAR
jgi:pimeloyl-ACP methyl ester carboxylesterase